MLPPQRARRRHPERPAPIQTNGQRSDEPLNRSWVWGQVSARRAGDGITSTAGVGASRHDGAWPFNAFAPRGLSTVQPSVRWRLCHRERPPSTSVVRTRLALMGRSSVEGTLLRKRFVRLRTSRWRWPLPVQPLKMSCSGRCCWSMVSTSQRPMERSQPSWHRSSPVWSRWLWSRDWACRVLWLRLALSPPSFGSGLRGGRCCRESTAVETLRAGMPLLTASIRRILRGEDASPARESTGSAHPPWTWRELTDAPLGGAGPVAARSAGRWRGASMRRPPPARFVSPLASLKTGAGLGAGTPAGAARRVTCPSPSG